jgi:hypothetical protein
MKLLNLSSRSNILSADNTWHILPPSDLELQFARKTIGQQNTFYNKAGVQNKNSNIILSIYTYCSTDLKVPYLKINIKESGSFGLLQTHSLTKGVQIMDTHHIVFT